jgi:undecaprenyl diphosphate synthase
LSIPQIPSHVAIIMDGNGRWAQRRQHSRVYGHIRGATRVKEVVEEASRLGLQALTLFAFSTENWKRPDLEKAVLWKLLRRYLNRELGELDKNNVKLHVIGELDRLSEDLQQSINSAIQQLSNNTGLELTLALSYGSKKEIIHSAARFAEDCVAGKRSPYELSEELFQDYLWTSGLEGLAQVDLVIRTSGEQRVSNFLLWQAAYAEYVFMKVLWPDFKAEHLRTALDEFTRRVRRFGGVHTHHQGEPVTPHDGSAGLRSRTKSAELAEGT